MSSRWARPPSTRRTAARCTPPIRPASPGAPRGAQRRSSPPAPCRPRSAPRPGLGPPARLVLRRGRHQADVRPGVPLRPRGLRLVARSDRRAGAERARRGACPFGDQRPRLEGRHLRGPGLSAPPHGSRVAPGIRDRDSQGVLPARSRCRRTARLRRGRPAAPGTRCRGARGLAAAHGVRRADLLHPGARRGLIQPGPLRRGPLRSALRRQPRRAGAVPPHARRGLRRGGAAARPRGNVRAFVGLLRRVLPQGPADARPDRAGFPQRLRSRRGPAVHADHAEPGVQGGGEARRPGSHVPLGHLHRDREPRRAPCALPSDRADQGPAGRRAIHRPGLSRGRDARSGVRARASGAGRRSGGGLMAGGWETVIGLETHVQLRTASKMFCGCSAAFGAAPNTNVCPVCLGLPGALPVANELALRLAVRAALALGCTVHPRSVFARKNYFYPDLPKGYQISQFESPLATDGSLSYLSPDRGIATATIVRLHVEEDAGKSLHDRFPKETAIDLNRCGVPLSEIVTGPDFRSPQEARAYLLTLKQVLEYAGASDCDMEKGSLRVDANVSVRRAGEAALGTKVEVKNINSFAYVEKALTVERDRFMTQYALSVNDADVLTGDRAVADYYEAVVHAGADAKLGANWVINEVLADAKTHEEQLRVPPGALAQLIGLVRGGTLSQQAAKRVFAEVAERGGEPRNVAEALGVVQVADSGVVAGWVTEVLGAHPHEVVRYRQGETKLMPFFVGQVMKVSRGKADPKLAQRILEEKLAA